MAEENLLTSTLQIVDLPVGTSDEIIEDIFSNIGPLKRCFVVRPRVPKAEKTPGYVQFAFSDDAAKAFKVLNGSIQIGEEDFKIRFVADKPSKNAQAENDAEIQKDFLKKREDVEYAKKKKARLIVRNLSFKATDESLRAYFEKCGAVEDVNILKKKDGKMVGCAFIQFSRVPEASKAIKLLNGKPFLQRPIAVDWAVSKKEYDQKSSEVKTEESEEKVATVNEDVNNQVKDDENNTDSDEPNEDSYEDEENHDSSDFDGESEEDEGDSKLRSKSWPKAGHDVAENKTVFLRNLSFDTDQDDLRDLMEEYFGQVFFAVLVKDKMTERPRGTAFVKFVSPESADKCVKASETEGIYLDTRQIYAAMAIPKADADQKQKEKKKKEPKDSRNLYLAREGLIREGTLSAQGVSKSDLEKRVKLERYKKQILQNLSMFVSPVRLCIRNLPPSLDNNDDLIKIIKKYTDIKEGRITEAKIMKDLKNGGQSKGYAFVSFSTHQGALNCLRKMNNNPAVFTKQARPIIDFSIENRKAIQAREKRLQKSQEKNPQIKAGGKKKDTGKNKKKSGHVTPKIEGGDKPVFMGSQGDPKIKNLPTHVGPKIRHKTPKISRRDMQKQDKSKKLNKKRKQDFQSSEKAETEIKRQKTVAPPKSNKKLNQLKAEKEAEKKFSSLVQSYKTRMMSTEISNSKSKWFE